MGGRCHLSVGGYIVVTSKISFLADRRESDRIYLPPLLSDAPLPSHFSRAVPKEEGRPTAAIAEQRAADEKAAQEDAATKITLRDRREATAPRFEASMTLLGRRRLQGQG